MKFEENDERFLDAAIDSAARAERISSLTSLRRQQYIIVLLLLLMILVEFAVMLSNRVYFSLPLVLGFSFGGMLFTVMFTAWIRTDSHIKLLKVVEKMAK